jgi:Fe-S cluster biogenesis protein NfuA
MSDQIIVKIKDELEKVRPHLKMDGGDVEFVDFDKETGVLKLRLQGACAGCPMSQVTLQDGIGAAVKKNVPEVKEVQNV